MVKSNFNFNVSSLIGARPRVLKLLRKRFVVDQAFAWKWTKSVAISNVIAVLAILDRWRYSKRSGTITIDQPPVFIIGHWRSGTTHLHNLMTLDSKAAYPTTFQNVFPNNLFAFQKVIKGCMKIFLPASRPGDSLPLHVDQPQEEEFAIGNETGISFYNWMFFPRDAAYFRETFLEGKLLTKEMEIAWKKNYVQFVKRTLLNSGGNTFVSKNPPNTARIPWLLDLFPNAKFIFIHRDPYDVYCSTIKFFKGVLKPLQFSIILKLISKSIYSQVMSIYTRHTLGMLI